MAAYHKICPLVDSFKTANAFKTLMQQNQKELILTW